jgi:hypothetical protein
MGSNLEARVCARYQEGKIMVVNKNKVLCEGETAKRGRRSLAQLIGGSALAAVLLIAPASYAGTDFAGLVLNKTVTTAVTVAPGGQVHGLAFASGSVPADGVSSYSAINRAIVFVTAGANATTCTVGLSDGAVKSAPISVSANTTVAITLEDKGGPVPPGFFETTGFVIYAGPSGGLTVLPGSSATKTVYATQPKS